jgi:4-amino-4-deoxy-L-arabinose transferase-like glycosyltransferase
VIVVVGAAVRFATIGAQDLWFDEHITAGIVGRSPLDLLASVQESANPALYYLVAGAWETALGSGDAAIRSLSALLGTATIPVVYAAVSGLGTRRAPLIAAALTATSPLLIWYSQEARNYSLLVLLAALSFLCFVRALEERDEQRWLWGWAVTSALALATHYFALFLILPLAAWLFVFRLGRRLDTALAGGAIAAVGIALSPLLATQREGVAWIEVIALSDRLAQVPPHFLIGLEAPWGALPALAVAAVAAFVVYAAARATSWERRSVAIAWGLVIAGLACVGAAGVAGEDFIISRNLLPLWVPFAAGLAVLLGSDRIRPIGAIAAAALCAGGLAFAVWTAATPEAQRPAYSDLADRLGPAGAERLIVSQGAFNRPLARYLEDGRIASPEETTARELVVIDPRPTESYAVGPCWWVAICGGEDLFPSPRFEPPDELRLERAGATRLFDYRVYSAPEPVEIPGLTELYFPPRVFVQSPPRS